MSRWLVYVNTNSTEKHITIHEERIKICGHLFKNIKKDGKNSKKTSIRILPGGAIKIGWTKNGYWLVVHAKNKNGISKQDDVLKASKKLGVPIDFCTLC
jgi:hypothetical protein